MADAEECPFCSILRGEAPGTIIARDDEKGFALIRSIHPESIVHWLAIPTSHIDSTEVMEQLHYVREWGGTFVTMVPSLELL